MISKTVAFKQKKNDINLLISHQKTNVHGLWWDYAIERLQNIQIDKNKNLQKINENILANEIISHYPNNIYYFNHYF